MKNPKILSLMINHPTLIFRDAKALVDIECFHQYTIQEAIDLVDQEGITAQQVLDALECGVWADIPGKLRYFTNLSKETRWHLSLIYNSEMNDGIDTAMWALARQHADDRTRRVTVWSLPPDAQSWKITIWGKAKRLEVMPEQFPNAATAVRHAIRLCEPRSLTQNVNYELFCDADSYLHCTDRNFFGVIRGGKFHPRDGTHFPSVKATS